MKLKTLRKLIVLKFVIFLNISFLLYSDIGKDYLIEDINLKITSYQQETKKTCEYKIDKLNNLIYLDVENSKEKRKYIERDVYYYNFLYNASLEKDVYKFWLDKEVDLQKEGLYINGKLSIIDDDKEKIYLVEYLTGERNIKVPIILENDYILGDGNNIKKFKIKSREKKLKDIQYFILYNFINYVNEFEECF